MSVQNLRTAIGHLKETGEVAVNRHPKFQVISIKNYDRYQSVGSQTAGNRQQSKNERIEESKNKINLLGIYPPIDKYHYYFQYQYQLQYQYQYQYRLYSFEYNCILLYLLYSFVFPIFS